MGAQWLSGRALDSRPKGRGFEPHRCHCVVSLSKNINPSLVLVQPRNTCPFITERLLMGRKESNQTNKQKLHLNESCTGFRHRSRKFCVVGGGEGEGVENLDVFFCFSHHFSHHIF